MLRGEGEKMVLDNKLSHAVSPSIPTKRSGVMAPNLLDPPPLPGTCWVLAAAAVVFMGITEFVQPNKEEEKKTTNTT